MNPSRRLLSGGLVACLLAVPAMRAQPNSPHLAYVYPAGGRQGTTFQVQVGGQFLAGAARAFFTGGGIQATVGEYTRPMSAAQAAQLREKLQELQKQSQDVAVQKEIADIRMKLLTFARNRNISPALAETVTLQVTMAPDADPGKRELRLATPTGLSNPLVFHVGELPEFSEQESLQVGIPPGTSQPQLSQAATDMKITLPAVVNGRVKPGVGRPQVPPRPGQQFTPGDADRYRFQARQGQHLIAAASARNLMPYLADAVPGWFQATLALYDATENELSYDDDFRFHPDPVLHYRIPRDGEYTVEIKDALYRGREDFVYRIHIGELPFITGIFPLGGPAGTRTTVELSGWNLAVKTLTMDAGNKAPGIYPLCAGQGEQASNAVPFMVDALPEIREKKPNNSQKRAQKVMLPVIVNGRIDQPGDEDVFSFEGRAGEEIVAEIWARRLDSPMDSFLRLTDSRGQQLAFNDDHEDNGFGWNTHHADSLLAVKLPANGTFYLHLGDTQRKGGQEYAYRLRISPPRPDFDLRVVPSSINAVGGMTVPLTVHALRKDGFAGDIALALKDGPRGFTLAGGLVPAGQDRVRFTLTIPPMPAGEPLSLSLQGRAIIQSQEVLRPAAPAEDMMQAFAYRHLVPAEGLKVAILRRGLLKIPARVLGEKPLKIPAGGTITIQAQVQTPPNAAGILQFELSEPPEGISMRDAVVAQAGAEIALQCDAAKVKAGTRGNLIVNILIERQPAAGSGRPQANRQRISLGTLPAIPFEIVNP